MTIRRVLLSVVVFALVSGACLSDGAAQTPPTLEGLDQRTSGIETQITDIQTSLADIKDQLHTLIGQGAGAPPLPEDLSLEQRIEILEEAFSELQTIVRQISTQNSDGYSPNILAKMTESESFRSEVGKAVQGKLRFRNYTGVGQVLYVNGSPWRVLPGESHIYVPYGVVTTAQSPFDTPTEWKADNWTFSGSNPEMVVVIQP